MSLLKTTSFLLLILLNMNLYAQQNCEIFCAVSNSMINVCSECDNVIFADNCADAATPSLCEIDGFSSLNCGSTIDGPSGLPNFCGPGTIAHNNMWIGFTPTSSGRLHINVEIVECFRVNPNCNGMQASIARALCSNPGNVFSGFEYETLDCVNCIDQTFDLITVDAIAGVPHYVVLDACCEDVCEIIVHVIDGLPEPSWTLEPISGTLCPDILNPDCLSPNSTAIVFANPNSNADPNAELEFTWFDPSGNIIWQGLGIPAGGQQFSSLTGINPLTGEPYFCQPGEYIVTCRDLSTCCVDEAQVELFVGEPPSATATFLDPEKDQLDCEVETLKLIGQPDDADTNILFQNWWKVDWSFFPPERDFLPSEIGSQGPELTVTLENIPSGAGTYLYTFIDRDAFCISETFICVPADTIKPFFEVEPPLELDCITNQTVTLDATNSKVERVIIDCTVGNIRLGEFPEEEIVETDNYTVEWTSPDDHLILDSDGFMPTVSDVGWYFCTITNLDNNCVTVDSVFVGGSVEPPIVSLPDDAVLGCEITEILIQGEVENGTNFTYSWMDSSGAIISTSSSYLVTAPDVYTLLVANSDNNCLGQATIIITENSEGPEIILETPAIITCTQTSVDIDATITGSSNYFYSWLNADGIELANTEDFTAVQPGTYTLIVTDIDNGCTSAESITVLGDVDIPILDSFSDLILNCSNVSLVEALANASDTNGSPLDFEWLDASMNVLSSAALITITSPGVYTVIASNPFSGCSASETLIVTQDIEQPVVDPGTAEELTCINPSVTLQGSASGGSNFVYEWSDANGVISNTNTATTSASGIYTLTVTNTDNGCSNAESITVEENVALPQGLTITGGEFSCAVTALEIMGGSTSPNVSYEWTFPDNFTATTPTVSITNPGTYTLVVTNEDNGCADEITTEITASTDVPSVSFEFLNGTEPLLDCINNVAEINGISGPGIELIWTLPNGSEVANPIITSEEGVYLLTAFDPVSICTNETTLNIIADVNPPVLETTSGTITCNNSGVEISATDIRPGTFGTGFVWTFPDNTTSSISNPTVSQPGIYTLVATGVNGCTAESFVEVLSDVLDPGASGAPDFELTCDQTTYDLEGTTTTGNQFNWNGPGGFNSNEANPTIDQAGLYVLTVTNTNNNCESEYQVMISQNIEAPLAIVPPDATLDCNTPNIDLAGETDSGNTNPIYTWTLPDGTISNDQLIIVSSEGVYQLVVENEANGCTSMQTVVVSEDFAEPTVTAEGATITCIMPVVTIQGETTTAKATFSWFGPNGFTSTVEDPMVTDEGNYTLIVTASNGCTAMATATVDINSDGISTWYADTDADGYGDLQNSITSCEQPDGYISDSGDCDDANPDVNPDATEVCDGVDNNCNGEIDEDLLMTWFVDADGDGFGDPEVTIEDCAQPINGVDNNLDCDDTNPDVNPDAAEICDGIDNNCNGEIDEGLLMTWFVDADGDGFGDPENTIEDCAQPINGVNNDLDCDDANAEINPDTAEVCDGIDNNCNGEIDEGLLMTWFVDADADGFGDPAVTLEDCNQPANATDNNLDCDDSNPDINPDATEVCDNIDNNCNGEIDEGLLMTWYADADGDGFGDPEVTLEECEQPLNSSDNNLDCDDSNPDINPDATEVCDNIDNNCNGEIDEGLLMTWYADVDEDGFGDPEATIEDCEQPMSTSDNNLDCDDTNPDINPDAEDIPNNGIDEDCDGMDLVTSIQDIDPFDVKVFPNPVSSILFLEIAEVRNYEINIIDVLGRTHFAIKNQTRIDVSSLPNGTYLVEIIDLENRKSLVKHIVVAK